MQTTSDKSQNEQLIEAEVEGILMASRGRKYHGFELTEHCAVRLEDSRITDFTIRMAIRRLRARGVCIVADAQGYWIPDNHLDIKIYLDKRDKKLKGQRSCLRAMNRWATAYITK